MSDQFLRIKKALAEGVVPSVDYTDDHDNCSQRLCMALASIQDRGQCGKADIASLVRHLLRQEEELEGRPNETIRLPKGPKWPAPDLLRAMGLLVLHDDKESRVVRALPWRPSWLRGADKEPPSAASFALAPRRSYKAVPGDPFLIPLGLDSYLNVAQRETVRSVLTAPVGSTLLVNLPTGSGKSLCSQLLSLIDAPRPGVVVVIEPTTALCLDQQRAIQNLVEHPTAYYTSSASASEARNKAIRSRIRDGTQRIVFTSPESLVMSLAGPVYEAARAGLLRALVIDEAHMVEAWGDDFRPEFQQISGLRRDLLRICGDQMFVTLLLSATVTEPCLRALKGLFGEPGPFAVVSSVQIRPEPSYWFAWCRSDDIREERIKEAVMNLPRPLILYTTEVKHAKHWAKVLHDLDFLRCRAVTGRTPNEERSEIILQWRARELDIVVATSAFGLGVDQADVRTVIHACIPEGIDRFYQEVGRGGRDGMASLSLVLYTADDYKTAASIASKRIITIEKGLPRWKAMFSNKLSLGSGRFRMPVDVSPPYDIDMSNEKNVFWNRSTLMLMSRAGMISIDSEPPPTAQNGEGQPQADLGETSEYKRYLDSVVIKIREQGHLDAETWERLILPERQSAQDSAREGMKLMKEAIRGKRCMGEILAEAYSLEAESEGIETKAILASVSCGGCQECREQERDPLEGVLPAPTIPWSFFERTERDLEDLLGDGNLLSIFYDPLYRDEELKERLCSVTRWFVTRGVSNLVVPLEYRDRITSVIGNSRNKRVFYFKDFAAFRMPKLPTIAIHGRGEPVPTSYFRHRTGMGLVLLLPDDAISPFKAHCILKDMTENKYDLDEFCNQKGL